MKIISCLEGAVPSPQLSRLLVLDLDSTLETVEGRWLSDLRHRLNQEGCGTEEALAIHSGRSLAQARQRYAELHLPDPQVWLTRAGSEIHVGAELEYDTLWQQQIAQDWDRDVVVEALDDLQDYFSEQDPAHQGPFKVSYLLRESDPQVVSMVRSRLRRRGLHAHPKLRCHWYLDVLPRRASRSEAIRHLALRWKLRFDQVLIVASQQGDGELLEGLPAAVVPSDHDLSLERQRHHHRVYVSAKPGVAGVLDGLSHYRFSGLR